MRKNFRARFFCENSGGKMTEIGGGEGGDFEWHN